MPLLESAEATIPLAVPAVEEPLKRLWEALRNLRQEAGGVVVESIPWITLKHPLHPFQWRLLEEPPTSSCAAGRMNRLLRFGRLLVEAFRLSLRLIGIKLSCSRFLRQAKSIEFHLVAKTWVFSGRTTLDDFYYGDLSRRLLERGVRMLLLASDPRGWRYPVAASIEEGGSAQIPEWLLVPVWAPFQAILMQWKASERLHRWAKNQKPGLRQKVGWSASREALSHGVTSKVLYAWIGREAAQLFKPKAMLTLYEGHGWERCLLQAAQKEDPACITIGYQHTILMPYQGELLWPLPRELPPRPKVVLCLGERTRELLQGAHPASRLVVFGSFRWDSSGNGLVPPAADRKTVLVLPEGFPEEARRLFDCAQEAAASLRDHRFILRCHPVLPFEKVRQQLKRDPEAFPNVEVSRGRSIEEDFGRSSVVLYRGSSSVLYGILRGLKPLYLEGGPDIDPLFELRVWRGRLENADHLVQAIRAYENSSREEVMASWQEAADYVKRYTRAVQEEAVQELCQIVRGAP